MESRCVYSQCDNYKLSNVIQVKFPEERSLQLKWIENIGNQSLLDLSSESLRKKSICLSHFDKKCRSNSGKLVKDAVPVCHSARPPKEKEIVRPRRDLSIRKLEDPFGPYVGYGKKCIYFGCGKKRSHNPCVCFPPARVKQLIWIENIGAPKLIDLPVERLRKEVICRDHFDPEVRACCKFFNPIHYLQSGATTPSTSDISLSTSAVSPPSTVRLLPPSPEPFELQPLTVNVTPSLKSYAKPQDDYNFEFDESSTVEILTPPLPDDVDPLWITEEALENRESQPCLMFAEDVINQSLQSSKEPCLKVAGERMRCDREAKTKNSKLSQPTQEKMKSREHLKTGSASVAVEMNNEACVEPMPHLNAAEETSKIRQSVKTSKEMSQPGKSGYQNIQPLSPLYVTTPDLTKNVTRSKPSLSPPLTLNVTPSMKCYSKPEKFVQEIEVKTYIPEPLSPPLWIKHDWNIFKNEKEIDEEFSMGEQEETMGEQWEQQQETAELLDIAEDHLDTIEQLDIEDQPELPETTEVPQEDSNDASNENSAQDEEPMNSENTILGTHWEVISFIEGDQELLKPIPKKTTSKKDCSECSQLENQLSEAIKERSKTKRTIFKLKKRIEAARLQTKLSKFLLECKSSATSESR